MIRCECGGRVKLQDGGMDDSGRSWEQYKCARCRRTGTMEFGGGEPEDLGGCLVAGVTGRAGP